MNRREILKFLAAVPIASVLSGCQSSPTLAAPSPSPSPSASPLKDKSIHTVQVLFEGAFTLVLQKNNPNRLIAFVPRIDNDRDLAHDFFFNDPSTPKVALEKEPAGYHFQLSGEGLRSNSDTYINPGLADFTAETQKWRLPDRIVTIELPFPNSINFSGRPLNVTFASGKKGMMPTNYLLEYYVENAEKVQLMCSQLEGKCPASPNCPPGVLRFFFGVSPQVKGDRPNHAVKFFNAMLRTAFPDLEARYQLSHVEPSEELRKSQTAGVNIPRLVPAVVSSVTPAAHLVRASAVLDCQAGGLIVRTHTGPTGG